MNLKDEILKLAANAVLVVGKTDEETKQMRRAICDQCDRRDKESDRCKVCLCYLQIKTGTKINRGKFGRIELTHCPLGKWGDKETANIYRELDGLDPLT